MDLDVSSAQASLAARSAQSGSVESMRASLRGGKPAEAAAKFEALFASQLVKEMRKSLGDGFFGSGPQADVYGGWLDQFLGEAIAKGGGLHIGEEVRASIERKQEAEADPASIGAPGSRNAAGESSGTGAETAPSPAVPGAFDSADMRRSTSSAGRPAFGAGPAPASVAAGTTKESKS